MVFTVWLLLSQHVLSSSDPDFVCNFEQIQRLKCVFIRLSSSKISALTCAKVHCIFVAKYHHLV